MTEKELRDMLIGENGEATFSKNYLIEAGAGAGKTHTMINRIINNMLRENGAKPEEIVAITFTEKATQEMMGRIDKELREKLNKEKDANQKQKLKKLVDGIGLMQISTIHSFCQKLLTTMPFCTEVGPGFAIMDDDEARAYAKYYYNEHIAIETQELKYIVDLTGFKYEDIRAQFLAHCNNNNKIVCSNDIIQKRVDSIFDKCLDILGAIRANNELLNLKCMIWGQEKQAFVDAFNAAKGVGLNSFVNVLNNTNRKNNSKKSMDGLVDMGVDSVYDKCCENIQTKSGKQEIIKILAMQKSELLMKYLQEDDGNFQDNLRDEYEDVAKDINDAKKKLDLIKEEWQNLKFMALFRFLLPHIEKYKKQKVEDKKLTQNDLVYYTCHMLRTSQDARKYFHERYKYFYVDEMQDTDLVQAQILFYLTASDSKEENWQNCIPKPGRLFLVGDPKQAIYRFRGGDITVYNTLKNLFVKLPAHEYVTLNFNNRSSEEICDFVNKTFEPLLPQVGTQHQAQYNPTEARYGASGLSSVIKYSLDNAEDPQREDAQKLAEFILCMVKAGKLIGADGNEATGKESNKHKANWGDFLILTKKKEDTAIYAEELAKLNIPCNVTGEMRLDSAPIIRKIKAVLEFLLDYNDTTKLVLVLNKCYKVPLPEIAAYKLRTNSLSIYADKVKNAFEEEVKQGNSQDKERFGKILSALDELKYFKKLVDTKPGMTILETIIDKSCACWTQEQPEEVYKNYAAARQLLERVRAKGYMSFLEVAKNAITISNSVVERELILKLGQDEEGKPVEDCVRVMNLHKAKGLESEVVILAYALAKEYPPEKHIVHDGDNITEYLCWSETYFGNTVIKACIDNWSTHALEESRFAEAESLRLQYVAATRPKSILLICAEDKKSEEGNTQVESYWQTIAENAPLGDLMASFGLVKAEADNLESKASVAKDQVQQKLEDKLAIANKLSTFHISPSTLDHNKRSVNDPDDSGAAKPATVNTEDTTEEDTSPSTDVQANGQNDGSNSNGQKQPFVQPSHPYGADWGTIIHRIMELTLKKKGYTEKAIRTFAVQAIMETLDLDSLNSEQRRLLLSNKALADPLQYLEDEAYVYVVSALADGSQLRNFIAGDNVKLFAEEPLAVYKDDEAFLKLVYAAVAKKDKPEDESLPVALNGIIDLAVKKDDGWYIIDYKTDILKGKEIEEYAANKTSPSYEARLKNEYTNQLTCYKTILGLKGYEVKGLYLCALSLGGKLIELDVK